MTSNFIEDLKELSQTAPVNKIKLQKQFFCISKLTDRVLEQIKHIAKNQGIKIEQHIGQGATIPDGSVYGDEQRLERLFGYVLVEAIKMSSSRSNLTVCLKVVDIHSIDSRDADRMIDALQN